MKNTKRRMELLSFYDHTGIAARMEKMAAEGWFIERITSFGWVYRRIEPKKLHFAVSYYPKASEFDPEPSEEQRMFHDFCEHSGWMLAAASAQMICAKPRERKLKHTSRLRNSLVVLFLSASLAVSRPKRRKRAFPIERCTGMAFAVSQTGCTQKPLSLAISTTTSRKMRTKIRFLRGTATCSTILSALGDI